VLAHGLWERPPRRAARERVALFNLATAITLMLGVAAFYAALFALTLVGAAVLIPPDELRAAVHHAVGVDDYVRRAWLAAPMAMIGGALGSLVDSDSAVRDAAYRRHPDERTEAGT
jgi:hypothetical protein